MEKAELDSRAVAINFFRKMPKMPCEKLEIYEFMMYIKRNLG